MRSYDWLGVGLAKARSVEKQNPWHDQQGQFTERENAYMYVGHAEGDNQVVLVEPGGAISDRLFSNDDLERLSNLKDDDGQPTTTARMAQNMAQGRQQEGWEERERAYVQQIRDRVPTVAGAAQPEEAPSEEAPSPEEAEEEGGAGEAVEYHQLPPEVRERFSDLAATVLANSTRGLSNDILTRLRDTREDIEQQYPNALDEFPYTLRQLDRLVEAQGFLLSSIPSQEAAPVIGGLRAYAGGRTDLEFITELAEQYDDLNARYHGALDLRYGHRRDWLERDLQRIDAGEAPVGTGSTYASLSAEERTLLREYSLAVSSGALHPDDIRDSLAFLDSIDDAYPGALGDTSIHRYLEAEAALAASAPPPEDVIEVTEVPTLDRQTKSALTRLRNKGVVEEAYSTMAFLTELHPATTESVLADMSIAPGDADYDAREEQIKQALEVLGDTPSKKTLEEVYAPPSNLTLHVNYLLHTSIYAPRLDYEITWRDEYGVTVVTQRRRYQKDTVYAGLSEASENYKDTLLCMEFLAKEADMVIKMGRKKMVCTANIDRGGYAWGNSGFDFVRANERAEMANRFIGGLRSVFTVLESVVVDSGKTPEEAKEIVRPLVDAAKEKFTRDPQTGRMPIHHAWNFADLYIPIPKEYHDALIEKMSNTTRYYAGRYSELIPKMNGAIKRGLWGRYFMYGTEWKAKIDLKAGNPGRVRNDTIRNRVIAARKRRKVRQARDAAVRAAAPQETPEAVPVTHSMDLFGKSIVKTQDTFENGVSDFLYPDSIEEQQAWIMEHVSGNDMLYIDVQIGPDGRFIVETKPLREGARRFREESEEGAE